MEGWFFKTRDHKISYIYKALVAQLSAQEHCLAHLLSNNKQHCPASLMGKEEKTVEQEYNCSPLEIAATTSNRVKPPWKATGAVVKIFIDIVIKNWTQSRFYESLLCGPHLEDIFPEYYVCLCAFEQSLYWWQVIISLNTSNTLGRLYSIILE